MRSSVASGLLLVVLPLAMGTYAMAQTVYVDPMNADGEVVFASLNQAALHLTTNGQPGETKRILVMTNRLEIAADVDEGGVRWSDDDDLIIDGDGDRDGVWCTLVCGENVLFNGTPNTENVVFRIQRSAAQGWDARVVLRNFIMIPQWQGPGAVTQVARGPFSAALGSHPETAGEILLENIIITASLPDGTPANPFQPLPADATRWFRGLHTGSKASTPTQARTRFDFRNVVISGTSLSAVTWFGDNSDVRFGPGFVVTNSGANPVISIVNSAFHNRLSFVGDSLNRNLFWNNGLGTSSSVIQVDDGGSSGTSIEAMAHSDFLLNSQSVFIDVTGGVGPVSHVVTVSDGSAIFLKAMDGQDAPIVVRHSAFVGSSAEEVTWRIEADGEREILLKDTLSFGGVVHVDALGGDALAWRTSPPPTAVAASFQSSNSLSIPPEVASSDPADFPLPADIAAWRRGRISLEQSDFLRPIDSSAPQGIHAPARSVAPLDGGTVGVVGVPVQRTLAAIGDVLVTGLDAGAAALPASGDSLWAWREGASREHGPFAGAVWRDLSTGEPLASARSLEAFIVRVIPEAPPIWIPGVLRSPGTVGLPTAASGVQSTLPWPGRLSDTEVSGGDVESEFFVFEDGTWRGAVFGDTTSGWAPLMGEDAPGLEAFAPALRIHSPSTPGEVLVAPATAP
jgi:hypothetical protein